MFKKDNIYFGMGIAAATPPIVFLIFYTIIWLVVTIFGLYPFMMHSQLAVLSIAPDFILLRIFFSGKKLHETGKGILLLTFAWVLVIFLFKDFWTQIHLPGLKYY